MRLPPIGDMLAICFLVVLIIILGAGLSGCTTTKTVYVPAPCLAPRIPAEPHYPVADLKPGDGAATVVKAYVASMAMCRDDNASVRRVCGG